MKTIYFTAITFLALLLSCSNNKDDRLASVLISNKDHKACCISFTSDETGKPVISWSETTREGKKLFFFSYLDKGSNSFAAPLNIPIEQNTNLHEEGMPKIAIKKDGSIIAVYETSAPTNENKFAGFVRYIQSFDKGNNWTAPAYLHADTTSGKGHSFASVAMLADGEIGACWLDVSFGDNKRGRSVKFAKTNGQHGFTAEKIIDSFACQCCRTALSCDANGNIGIMFRDVLADSIRDISVCTSNDNGKTFGAAAAFTNDGWVINGCPHNGPSIAKDGEHSYAAWFTGGSHSGLYYAEMNRSNKIVERRMISDKGRNIQLCLLPDKARIVVFNENVKMADSFYSKIAINKMDRNGMWSMDISDEKSHAGYPVLHAVGKNSVIVAWEDNDKLYYRIVDANAINKPVAVIAETRQGYRPSLNVAQLAVNKDIVCGMPINKGVSDTAHYKGKIYGFCAAECKAEFVKNPELYLTAK